MTDTPVQQADLLVNILAKIHDSASIVQSNQHAALEAQQALQRDREEAARVRVETDKLRADTDAYWRQKAKEIEDMTALAAQMRKDADVEYSRRVGEAEAAGKAKHDAWVKRAQDVERDHAEKAARLQEIGGEVTKAQALLDGVRAEVRLLRERLNV